MIKLENWSTTNLFCNPQKPQVRLCGKVFGHPKFDNGEVVITSIIVHLDLDNNKAETYSGTLYTLGTPKKILN